MGIRIHVGWLLPRVSLLRNRRHAEQPRGTPTHQARRLINLGLRPREASQSNAKSPAPGQDVKRIFLDLHEPPREIHLASVRSACLTSQTTAMNSSAPL